MKLYEDKVPLFDKAEIESEIRDLFKRRCDLPSGGYLIIEQTEALVSVDVNSGRYTGKRDPEKTILRTNTEAAREVARQLRLRDIGGIIVCDFIDMETRQNREKVLQELRTHLSPRPRADEGVRGERARADRDDAPAGARRPLPQHDGAVPDLRRHRAGVQPREHGRGGWSGRCAGSPSEGKKDSLIVKLHPDVALYLLENEHDFARKLEKALSLPLDLRDDPLLKPDEFKLVLKGAERDVTQQYAVA